ncbi:MAG TPA: 30S ribosomal protein S17 [Candidatus Limnocylindria bacterium]|nr:30S ribosomal protein S17 [Candidatus Limnocylindria bacterium]
MAEKKTTAAAKKTTATKTVTKKTTAAAPRKTVARKTAAPAVEKKTAAPLKTVAKRTTVRRKAAPAAGEASRGTAPKTRRRTKVGMVVSAKMEKTVIVEVERMRQHPLYRKALRVGKRFAAHAEDGDVLAGDLVRIQESRPYSATKRWRVIEVISRAGEAGAAAPLVADIEKQLEAQEGVDEIFAKPEQPAGVGAEGDEGDADDTDGEKSS